MGGAPMVPDLDIGPNRLWLVPFEVMDHLTRLLYFLFGYPAPEHPNLRKSLPVTIKNTIAF